MKVVAGILVSQNRRLLLAKRPPKQGQKHSLWEFPGGKVEKHESSVEALIRELNEELRIQSENHLFFQEHVAPNSRLSIRFYFCRFHGLLVPTEHKALAWVTPETLAQFPLCPTDGILAQSHGRELRHALDAFAHSTFGTKAPTG